MLVRNAMKRNVVVAEPTLTLKEASKVMTKLNIGSLVITKENKLLGIVTSTDILKCIAEDKDVEQTTVEMIMSKPVITIEPDKKIEEAVDIMLKNKIKRLVVTENNKIIGIITASDIISIEPKLIEQLSQLISLKLPGYSGG